MKMMLVAINAKYIHSNLAVYSLYSYAKEYQENIVIGEYTINQSSNEILKDIYQERPEILGFSCYIWNVSQVFEIANEIHKVLPATKIWLGGPEVSYDAAALLEKYDFITGIMCGEGEQTFTEVLAHYHQGNSDWATIDGIVWRDMAGEIMVNNARIPINLDHLPFVYDHFPENKIIYYESSRGCPFSCSYCLSSIDKKLRFRNQEIVKKELQYFLDANVAQVKFVDRTFNCNHEHAQAIWSYLKEHDNGITNFHFEISADILNEEEVRLLNSLRRGQVQLEIGVQSINPQTLVAINRTMNFAKVKKYVGEVAKGRNVHQHLDLIVGLPHEDYESFKQSFNAIYELEPDQLQLGFLKVLKGSKMAIMAAEYGCLYQSKAPYEVLQTRWLSYEEVLKLKQVEEMVEVYYNSAQFVKTISEVVKLFLSPFTFYQELGAFYEMRKYTKVSHSRLQRYDILLEFLSEIPHANLAYYKELMIFDLYAREKLNKRPAWISEQMQDSQQIREFYQGKQEKRKTTHLEFFQYDIQNGQEILLDKPAKAVFDYQRRNVLTNNAEVDFL